MKSGLIVEPAHRKEALGGFGLTSLRALYWLTFRQHLHGKRWMVMAGLFILPAVLAIVIRATAPDAPKIMLEFLLGFMFIPQALLPLIALVYASGIIQDEQEEQTLTYLLVRPIPKWAVYFVKLLATLTTTVLLTTLFTILTYAAIYVGADTAGMNIPARCLNAVGIHALAVVCYCCLFGLISLMTRWTLVVGILYTAIFEVLIANLPFSIRLITVIYYTRLLAYRAMPFLYVPPQGNREENLAASAWQYQIDGQNKLLGDHPSTQTSLIVLGVACVVFTLIASAICARREFYVKTPEGT